MMLPREQNYSVGEREALAIVWVVNKFHRMVRISFWKVITGHWSIYRHHIPRIQDNEMEFLCNLTVTLSDT